MMSTARQVLIPGKRGKMQAVEQHFVSALEQYMELKEQTQKLRELVDQERLEHDDNITHWRLEFESMQEALISTQNEITEVNAECHKLQEKDDILRQQSRVYALDDETISALSLHDLQTYLRKCMTTLQRIQAEKTHRNGRS